MVITSRSAARSPTWDDASGYPDADAGMQADFFLDFTNTKFTMGVTAVYTALGVCIPEIPFASSHVGLLAADRLVITMHSKIPTKST